MSPETCCLYCFKINCYYELSGFEKLMTVVCSCSSQGYNKFIGICNAKGIHAEIKYYSRTDTSPACYMIKVNEFVPLKHMMHHDDLRRYIMSERSGTKTPYEKIKLTEEYFKLVSRYLDRHFERVFTGFEIKSYKVTDSVTRLNGKSFKKTFKISAKKLISED